MLACNGADQEKAQPSPFDAENIARRHPVEALENPLQVRRRNAQALIGNGQHHPCLALDCKIYLDLRSLGRILDRVVQDVEDGRLHILRVPHDSAFLRARVHGELDGRLLQVIALQYGAYALADHLVEYQGKANLVARPLSHFARLEHLFHGGQ